MMHLQSIPDITIPDELKNQFQCIIDIAKEVKKILGEGWYEEVYQNSLAVELRLRGYTAELEVPFETQYKGEVVGTVRPDILVRGENGFVIEVKRGDMFRGVHQLVQYLKVTELHVGYVIGFQEEKVTIWCVVNTSDGGVYVCENPVGYGLRRVVDVGQFSVE